MYPEFTQTNTSIPDSKSKKLKVTNFIKYQLMLKYAKEEINISKTVLLETKRAQGFRSRPSIYLILCKGAE